MKVIPARTVPLVSAPSPFRPSSRVHVLLASRAPLATKLLIRAMITLVKMAVLVPQHLCALVLLAIAAILAVKWPARVTATPVRMEASVSRSLPLLTRVPALMDSLALIAIKRWTHVPAAHARTEVRARPADQPSPVPALAAMVELPVTPWSIHVPAAHAKMVLSVLSQGQRSRVLVLLALLEQLAAVRLSWIHVPAAPARMVPSALSQGQHLAALALPDLQEQLAAVPCLQVLVSAHLVSTEVRVYPMAPMTLTATACLTGTMEIRVPLTRIPAHHHHANTAPHVLASRPLPTPASVHRLTLAPSVNF